MADKTGDAIALWQQMMGEMQKGFRAFSTQLAAAPALRNSSDQTAAGPNGAQKQLTDLMESYFAGLNLPSRAQLNGMSERLQAIESELTDIKALLHEALMNSKAMDADSAAPRSAVPHGAAPRPSRPRPKRPAAAKSQPQRGPVPAGKDEALIPEDDNKSSQ
jgi:hypothetical protein